MTNSAPCLFPPATISPLQTHTATSIQLTPPWRRILAVEPDIAVLNAKSVFLTNSNYCVTRATGDGDLFSLKGSEGFGLAMLSDRLGLRLLGNVAQIVRRNWPRTRILIVGHVPIKLEDYLYDEHIHRSSDPAKVLAALERLYQGMWNRRSNTIDWGAARSARCATRPEISESDPTKILRPAPTENRILRGIPSDLRIPVTRAA